MGFCARFGPFSGGSGPVLGHILGPFWAFWGGSGPLLDPFVAFLEVLGLFWAFFGCSKALGMCYAIVRGILGLFLAFLGGSGPDLGHIPNCSCCIKSAYLFR